MLGFRASGPDGAHGVELMCAVVDLPENYEDSVVMNRSALERLEPTTMEVEAGSVHPRPARGDCFPPMMKTYATCCTTSGTKTLLKDRSRWLKRRGSVRITGSSMSSRGEWTLLMRESIRTET